MSLTDRILHHVARASAQRPASADAVACALEADAGDCARAIEQLVTDRRLGRARIERDGRSWHAIWPTGLRQPQPSGRHPIGPQVAQRHGGLHATPTPRPARQRPSTTLIPPLETPMPNHKPTPNQTRLQQLLTGRQREDALSLQQIAEQLGITPEGAKYVVDALVARGLARSETVRSAQPGQQVRRRLIAYGPADAQVAPVAPIAPAAPIVPPATPDVAPAPAPVEPGAPGALTVPAAVPAAAAALAPLSFALWDDGTLSVTNQTEVIHCDADATRRLARLLTGQVTAVSV